MSFGTFELVVAVVAGLAILAKPATAGWRMARRTSRFLDVWEGTKETPSIPARIAKVEERTAQLERNGGGSVRDAVERIERVLADHIEDRRSRRPWRSS